jgi:hypothetical protein
MAAEQDRTANESRKGDEQITNSKQQSRQRYDEWQQPRPRARLWVVLVQHHQDLLTRNGHWAGLSAPPSVTEKVALHVCVIAPRCGSSSTFRTERTGEEPWPRQAIRSRAETPRPSEPGRKGL